jgi:MFS family permease
VFGALADKLSRRRLAVCAELLRAGCFVALALIPSFAATVAFAMLAGVGTALFRPAINAALPGMVPAERRSELTAIFYASVNAGLMLGPALAAALLLVARPSVVLVLNAVTFVVSAALLAGVELGPQPGPAAEASEGEGRSRLVGSRLVGSRSAGSRPVGSRVAGSRLAGSLLAETRAGARAVAGLPGVPVLLGVGALVVLTGAMFNVVAPLLATGPLRAHGRGYSVLMALYGAGMVAGSWANARAGSDLEGLRRRWLFGIALSGVAMAMAALAPSFGLALVAFALIGLGENLLVGPEMRLVQELVAEGLLGRVFGFKDVLENIAFVAAFVGAGALLSVAGVRAVFGGAGVLTLVLAGVGALAFRTRREARVVGGGGEPSALAAAPAASE